MFKLLFICAFSETASFILIQQIRANTQCHAKHQCFYEVILLTTSVIAQRTWPSLFNNAADDKRIDTANQEMFI